jgi:DNA-binding transcriptional ArsR family regulator
VHAALGDPARLAVVDTLTLGDASPGEIAAELGMPTNLVAHHVKVLQDAGLLTRTRSEGDRRRTYLRLVPGVLSTLTAPRLDGAERVVFVCTTSHGQGPVVVSRLTHQEQERRPCPRRRCRTTPTTRARHTDPRGDLRFAHGHRSPHESGTPTRVVTCGSPVGTDHHARSWWARPAVRPSRGTREPYPGQLTTGAFPACGTAGEPDLGHATAAPSRVRVAGCSTGNPGSERCLRCESGLADNR